MRAQRRGIPISEYSLSPPDRKIQHDPDAECSPQSPPEDVTIGDDDGGRVGATDEEGGIPARTRRATRLNMKKIAECREKSRSAWLHFPHVELVFLLFAFEGAVAAQVAAVRESSSPVIFILAISCLVSLFIYCFRRARGSLTRTSRARSCRGLVIHTPHEPISASSARTFVRQRPRRASMQLCLSGSHCCRVSCASDASSLDLSHLVVILRFSTRFS